MKMYRCDECESIFTEPKEMSDIHREIDTLIKYYYQVCPFCGSDQMECLHKCETEGCSNYIASGDYCETCQKIVHNAVDNICITYGISKDAVAEILSV